MLGSRRPIAVFVEQTMPEFNLRYAPHLGYLSPVPQFVQSVGNSDPYDHARFAHDQGFAGLFHPWRSEEHTSELQSLMRISYAVFCLKKNKKTQTHIHKNKH